MVGFDNRLLHYQPTAIICRIRKALVACPSHLRALWVVVRLEDFCQRRQPRRAQILEWTRIDDLWGAHFPIYRIRRRSGRHKQQGTGRGWISLKPANCSPYNQRTGRRTIHSRRRIGRTKFRANRYVGMVHRAEFRRKAKTCARLARAASDPGVKARYRIVAEQWLQLAGTGKSGGRARWQLSNRRMQERLNAASR